MEDVEISLAKGVPEEGEVQTEDLNIPTMEDGRSENVYRLRGQPRGGPRIRVDAWPGGQEE